MPRAARCPFPGSKELFELARVLLTIEGDGRAVRDAEIGNLVGFENTRTSRWKHGQINVSDAARLLSLSNALDVDVSILARVAAGQLRAEDAVPAVLDEDQHVRNLAEGARPPREGAPLVVSGAGGLEIVVEKRGRHRYERRERRRRATEPPEGRRRTAILVDDDPLTARVFENVVSQQPGFQSEVATSLTRALVAAGRLAPDLVVIDPFLPGADGFATLRALARDSSTRRALVVALVTRRSQDLLARALGAGASDVLERPLRAAALARLLRKVI